MVSGVLVEEEIDKCLEVKSFYRKVIMKRLDLLNSEQQDRISLLKKTVDQLESLLQEEKELFKRILNSHFKV